MRLTHRGFKTLTLIIATVILSFIFQDLYMLTIPAIVTVILVVEALMFRRVVAKLRDELVVEPREYSVKLIAGESYDVEFSIQPPKTLEFKLTPKWVTIKSFRHVVDTARLLIRVSLDISGVYSVNGLKASIHSRFKNLSEELTLPLTINVKAYPRVLPWIIKALRVLAAKAYVGFGENPIKRLGLGLEYAGTRTYIPGDSVRYIDWKATARFLKLMVKEFHEEVSAQPYIVYDARAPGSATRDELSTYLLSTVLGLVGDVSLAITLYRGSETIFHSENITPIDALKVVLTHVLEHYRVEEDVFELVEPKSAVEMVKIIERIRSEGLKKMLEFKRVKGYKPLETIVKGRYARMEIIFIGYPLYETLKLVDFIDRAKLQGHVFHVLAPRKPWIDSETLEQAYIVYTSYQKALSSISRRADINKILV